ncbi:uncharacterized protein LOC113225721 [Hyposmocoma kahamanoa]|uniref:uncharacterized protein LOC113225721 n=1 Tax=Hyposmocoma kahamanoa TaxID=1477025 RepID=UPI000E6D7436|nr:uncharacterized protein LOC113225721 [Hyposmocoma kahamanoa]
MSHSGHQDCQESIGAEVGSSLRDIGGSKCSIEENTDSKGTDIVLDLTINRNHNGSVIYCKFPRHAIIVEFVYEPNNPSPVDNRPNLLNAISYEIKSYDIGFACDTNTNITVKEGPLMVKISGNYDLVEHIWCQYTVYGADEKPRIFLTQDDFSEYENPKEAITIINAKNFGENKMEWNCTLLTWRGAMMYPTNVYYYEDIYYSRITCLGIVHIVSVAEENTLIFNVNNYNNTCESVEPTQNFTIQEGNTLTVKGFHLLSGEDFYQFC